MNGKRERERERNCAINEHCRAKRRPPQKKNARSRSPSHFRVFGRAFWREEETLPCFGGFDFFFPARSRFFSIFPDRKFAQLSSFPFESCCCCCRCSAERERERDTTPPLDRTRERREKKLNERTNKRTRVLLDFGFHPSFQSVVEGFQKRRAVHLCRGGGGRRRG